MPVRQDKYGVWYYYRITPQEEMEFYNRAMSSSPAGESLLAARKRSGSRSVTARNSEEARDQRRAGERPLADQRPASDVRPGCDMA
jgi:hypothetical protein